MWDLLDLVLDNLEIKSKATEATRNQIIGFRENKNQARDYLILQERESNLNNCTQCDSRYFCSLFLACVYYELEVMVQTQVHIKHAIKDFRNMGSTWNELLANWIYGEILVQLGRNAPARRELEHTIEMLQKTAQDFRRDDQYDKQDKCFDFISKIRKRLNNPTHNWDGEAKQKEKNSPAVKVKTIRPLSHSQWRRSQLIFPVQSQVHAGIKGNFIFEDQPDLDAALDELSFGEELHYLYNIRDEGNPIMLSPKIYRWFRVQGNSMNKANPIPIKDNDYVLAIDLNMSKMRAQHGDIVIAELYNPTQNERAGVLKKYTSRGLESRSSREYPIIPFEGASMRGVAIAVAKPIHSLPLPSSPSSGHQYDASQEIQYVEEEQEIQQLYEDLLTKVLHDATTVERLVLHEKKLIPTATQKELLQNAIDRWIHDNR